MDDDGIPKSSITMEWEWPRVRELLETPTGQQCTLKVKKGKGEILHTTPERNLRELELLKSFITALSTDEICWPTRDENTQSVEEIMKIYLQDLKENPVKYVNEKYVETFEEVGHYEEDVLGRRFLDFTERIWLIIAHNATSYNDMNVVLKLVEEEFRTGHLQPMIYPDNTSSLACKIREFYLNAETPGQWKEFSLPDGSSLELLIGIALDKIRRDFTTYLIDNSLCLGHQISWYVPTKEVDLRDQAHRLQCLHHVLELALLTNGYLSRFISSNLDVIKTAILHYQSHHPDEEFTVIAPGIPKELKTLCQRSIPIQWQVELKETGPRENTLIVNLTRNPPFSHISSPQFDTTAEDLQDDEFISYYITKVRQHSVRFL
ncbi:Protein zwilch-like [Holothuria leucospilota]|uniref:Protein zwilch n=1 Tax=Holothuria leucospilota TaxID=206669 RepID=A0A9Q1HIZ9_HOLLE|nr:Protein zwilch-like [Holothuria leucospilota]